MIKKADLIAGIDKLKEKENRVTTRLKRLLHIVNHSLNHRKNSYLDLKDQLVNLINNRQETLVKVKTVERNIVIYEKNLEKIEILLKENEKQVIDIKIKYDTLLTGSVSNVVEYAGEPSSMNTINQSEDENSYMFLKLRKQSLMNSMDIIFKKYENEIDEMQNERQGIIEKKNKIKEKMQMAQNQRGLVLTDLKSYINEIYRIRELAKKRRKELKAVVLIYKGIIKKVQLSSTMKKKNRPALEVI